MLIIGGWIFSLKDALNSDSTMIADLCSAYGACKFISSEHTQAKKYMSLLCHHDSHFLDEMSLKCVDAMYYIAIHCRIYP